MPCYARHLSIPHSKIHSQHDTKLPSLTYLLKDLNDDFLSDLREEQQTRSSESKHIVILQGGNMSLWQSEGQEWKRTEKVSILTDEYHNYKSLAHLPVKIQRNCKNNALEKLKKTYLKLQRIKSHAALAGYEKHVALIDACMEAIVLYQVSPENKDMIINDLKAKTDRTVGKLMSLARLQVLPKIDQALEVWMKQYACGLKDIRMVIGAPHGPRRNLIESDHIRSIYREALGKKMKILDNYVYITEVLHSQLAQGDTLEKQLIDELLLPSQLNKEIGKDMLNAPYALFRDVLNKKGQRKAREEIVLEKEQDVLNDKGEWETQKCPYHKKGEI